MKILAKVSTIFLIVLSLFSASRAFGEAAIGINVLFKGAITQANLTISRSSAPFSTP
jgi:hypothetical protein